jgi:ABC-type nitrate/sulfonate/bicarbonate transport system substrate-binding protein
MTTDNRFHLNKIILILTVILLAASLPTCTRSSQKKKPDSVTLQLNWFHEVQFSGYYAADAQGFYREENLQVNILQKPRKTDFTNYQELFKNTDFAIMGGGTIRTIIESGGPVTALMAALQSSPTVLFALAQSGIEKPSDFIGKRVAIKDENWRNIIHKTLKKVEIDPGEIIEVEVNYNAIEMLYTGEVDIWTGYVHDEPNEAQMAGFKVNLIFPAEYGIESYEGLLVVPDETISRDPELVARFVRASQRGWLFAVEHPEKTAGIVAQWQPDDSLKFHQIAMRALVPLLVPKIELGHVPIGWIDDKFWQITMGTSYDSERPGYTMRFIEETQE